MWGFFLYRSRQNTLLQCIYSQRSKNYVIQQQKEVGIIFHWISRTHEVTLECTQSIILFFSLILISKSKWRGDIFLFILGFFIYFFVVMCGNIKKEIIDRSISKEIKKIKILISLKRLRDERTQEDNYRDLTLQLPNSCRWHEDSWLTIENFCKKCQVCRLKNHL